jgi:hypothetical protein
MKKEALYEYSLQAEQKKLLFWNIPCCTRTSSKQSRAFCH